MATNDRQSKIIANRKRTLERLQGRRKSDSASGTKLARVTPSATADAASQLKPASTHISTRFISPKDPPRRPQPTPEQRAKMEENRLRALEIQQNKQIQVVPPKGDGTYDGIRLNNNNKQDSGMGTASRYQPPSLRRKDYIEYDFSTMKDTRGGFMETEAGAEGEAAEKSVRVIYEDAPPMDVVNAPRCLECDLMEVDQQIMQHFHVQVCRKCARQMPEKYALLTKTECREDYLLTDPELRDVGLLPRMEKPNPHGFLRMQLFLRLQVEAFAWTKWGSSDGLDEEWERREQMRVKRRDKRYLDLLREMRKKTRAEEYTRKLRDGHSIGERHQHEWLAPVSVKGDDKSILRRCLGCGVETEELLI